MLSSMSEAGQRSPVVVVAEGPRFVVIDGFKRVRAARKLDQDTVDGTVWDLPVVEALALRDGLRRQGRPSALEEAWLIAALQAETGEGREQIARRLSRKPGWVKKRQELLERLPGPVQERVRRGEIDGSVASGPLLGLSQTSQRACERVAEAIAGKGVTTKEARELVKAYVRGTPEVKDRIVKDPGLFLKARREARERDEVTKKARALIGAARGIARAVAQSHEPVTVAARRLVEEALAILARLTQTARGTDNFLGVPARESCGWA